MKSINKELATNYFLVWGLVAVSGFPYFYRTQLFILALLIIALFIYLKRSVIFDPKCLNIIGAFFFIEILQILIIKPFEPQILAGTYMRLSVGFIIISLCQKNYIRYYVNIIYFFCILSFIFFIPSVISHSFYNFFVNHICIYFNPPGENIIAFYKEQPTIGFYTFSVATLEYRNSGPFWEPGAYAIFILIAMIFNITAEKKLWTKKNIVFSLSLISTLSTSGFIAFFLLLTFYYFITESMVKKIVFIAVALPVFFIAYNSLEFLSSKIKNNIEIADNDNTSRFGSALSDLKDFSSSPLIGWGRGSMRYGGKKFSFFSEEQHRNNGLTGLLATYGIFIFLFLFYNYFKSLKAICLSNSFPPIFAWASLGVIITLGFSQTIFQYPFFYSLMFVHLVYPKNSLNSSVNTELQAI